MKGLVLKGIGGFYTVWTPEGEIVCKARGRFRLDGITPVAGDEVEYEKEDSQGRIVSVLPRKNALIRPCVANIDRLAIVITASSPRPDLLLVDKLMLQAYMLSIEPMLVINKIDERDCELFNSVSEQYEAAGCMMLAVSTYSGEGMDKLRGMLAGKTTCFAGQSAVGKSSILNFLIPSLNLDVDTLVSRADRGKQTTRHAELWLIDNGGAVLDTPGFYLLDIDALEPEKLGEYYPEMRSHIRDCRFCECLHDTEPGCAVKPLIAQGKLSQGRYERYLELLEYFKTLRRRRYD
ncbi:MAG: putative ribosome biogenesis GTPase RsgA [Firmicutes bacterium ADurb.Bin182]|nr:MAG: putative ribosome biogenesis GTPase RsgA [Firmicutes bacterium ADurb.Bin182]